MSAFIDSTTRVSMIEGTAINNFQIPDRPGLPVGQSGNPPVTNVNGITNFNSALLNENQVEVTQYGVLALQKSVNGFDGQLSYFTRYNSLHFTPDPVGDLLLNGIASDITGRSYTNGLQGDGAYAINATIRFAQASRSAANRPSSAIHRSSNHASSVMVPTMVRPRT
jgi:hypothetical protein